MYILYYLRSYIAALCVYESAGWTHCDDHLYSALAKHSLGHLGIEVAVAYYVKLLKTQHRKPVERQVSRPL